MAKKTKVKSQNSDAVADNTAVSIFVVILVELTNTVFVNSTNITTHIETAVLSMIHQRILEMRAPDEIDSLCQNQIRFWSLMGQRDGLWSRCLI